MSLLEKLKEFNARAKEYESLKKNDRVLIVDSTNSYIRCFSATPTMNEDGDHVGGVSGFLKSIALYIRQYRPTRVICVFDGVGGNQRRRQLFSDYKQQRKSMTRLNRSYDFGELANEKESMRWQMHLLIEILDKLPVDVMAIDNVEADDTIAYLANIIQEKGGECHIMSTDKDFFQLASDNIKIYNPTKKKLYDVQAIVDEFEIHPINFPLYRAIDGDTSDNIEGVKGISRKTLVKYIPTLKENTKINIETLLETKTTAKFYDKLQEAVDSELIENNLELMTLDGELMSGNAKLKIIDKYNAPKSTLEKFELTKMLVEFKLTSIFGDLDGWLTATWNPLTRYKE